MKINQSNYEIFFLDYLDGKLSDNQVDEFLDFLKANPQLKKELESIKEITLPVDEVSFPWKNDLLKEDQEGSSFDYRAVAFMEGNLSDEDQKAFVEELDSDPEKEHEFDLILSTKLKRENIRYPYKNDLYKKPKLKFLYWSVRVAAIVVLLIAVRAVFQKEHAPLQEPPVFSETLAPVVDSDKNDKVQDQPQVKKKKPVEKINESKKDSIPKKTKSIREKTKGRLKELARNEQAIRIPAPGRITPLVASLEMNPGFDVFTLKEMKAKPLPKQPEYISVDKYLAQKFFKANKKGSEGNFAKKSLKAVSKWSNEKLAYETDAQGKVSKVSVHTSLLAFSIPFTKKE